MSGRLSSEHSRSHSRSSLRQRLSQGQQSEQMNRRSTSSQSSNPNVFSDEYSLESLDSEETTRPRRRPSISSLSSSDTLRSTSHLQKASNASTNEPSELTVNPFGDEARVSVDDIPRRSSLPQKGAEFANNRNSVTSVNTTSGPRRSQSISSRFSIPPQPLSPYMGATGPSHPYAMYPQVGVGRSPSVTTTSTMRPIDRPLTDANAPQHPYAMYSQNVVPEEIVDETAIPLGFPGHNAGYQRPLGRADDDVGDIVGPDGHTEQLPPYSRYPDGVVPKIGGGFETVHDANVIREESPNTGYGEQPGSEASSRALVPEHSPDEDRQPPAVAEEAEPTTGVMAFEEKLKKKGKKRVCCGLPIWTLVLIAVVLLIGACIGGVIGGVLGAKKATDEDEREATAGPKIVTVTATPEMDATPISTTPQGLLPLPTGQFMVPASPKNQSKFCVADSDYTSSWGCMSQGGIEIEIGGSDMDRTLTFANEPILGSFTYGAQAPYLPMPTQSLSMMFDTSEYGLGPALFFFSVIDKLVIVPQDAFPTNAASKRAITEDDLLAGNWRRKQVAKAGDRPWFCWWNSTVIEFFLYINETTKDAQSSSTATITDVYTATITGSSQMLKRRSSSLPDYPRKIKIEEKRDYSDALAPYCQQMQVMDDGSISTASPYTIDIQEVEPTPTTTIKGDGAQTYTATAQYESACYCVSMTD